MPLVPGSGDEHVLTREGRALLRLRSDAPRSGHDVRLEDGVGVEEAADAARAELGGWKLGAPEELAGALLARGAELGRHAHLHSRDLRADPPPAAWASAPAPAGGSFATVHWRDPDLADAVASAFPPGHPDRTGSDHGAPELERIVVDEVVGPLLPCSAVLLAADGRACAGILVTDRGGEAPWAGPWLALMFRHPDRAPRGGGRALLERALAAGAADGLATLSLVVTEGNPARRLYDALGLRRVASTISVTLPAKWSAR